MTGIAVLPRDGDGFTRKRWTVSECRTLVTNGLLEAGTYELVEGEILNKMGQGRLHIFVVARIIAVLTAIFGDRVQSQAQIGIGEIDPFNDPEPDVAVLASPLRDYLDREPDPVTDVLLVVEVSHSTLQGDLTTKARLYSRIGVPEYWVISIPHRELIVHRQPGAEGYQHIQKHNDQETVISLSAPDHLIRVADLLP